jgi:hypothetical protein
MSGAVLENRYCKAFEAFAERPSDRRKFCDDAVLLLFVDVRYRQ